MDDSKQILTLLCVLVFIFFICPLCLCILHTCMRNEINTEETEQEHSRQTISESENPIWRDSDSN